MQWKESQTMIGRCVGRAYLKFNAGDLPLAETMLSQVEVFQSNVKRQFRRVRTSVL